MTALAHMDDLNTSVNRAVDNDIARVGYGKAAVFRAKFRTGTPHVRMICKAMTLLLKAIDKAERIGGAALSDVVVNLL